MLRMRQEQRWDTCASEALEKKEWDGGVGGRMGQCGQIGHH